MSSQITNATLAQEINDLIALWKTRETQLVTWLSGAAGGGDYSNGTYPLSDYLGNVQYVESPAQMQADVTGTVNSAKTYANNASASATAASNAQTAAQTARDLALSYQNGAQSAQSLAQSAKSAASSSAAAALASQNAAKTSENNAATSANDASTSATNASNSASSASTSETNASNSATAASNSATAAANSATAAANSAASVNFSLTDNNTWTGENTFTPPSGYAVTFVGATLGATLFKASYNNASSAHLFGYADNAGSGITNADPQIGGALLYLSGNQTLVYSAGTEALSMGYGAGFPDGGSGWIQFQPSGLTISGYGGSNPALYTSASIVNGGGTMYSCYSSTTWTMLQDANDGWLRLASETTHYTNGIYTPGKMRVDDALSLNGSAASTARINFGNVDQYQLSANLGSFTYGSLWVSGASNGYQGIAIYDGWSNPTFMANGANTFGIFAQGLSAWGIWWDVTPNAHFDKSVIITGGLTIDGVSAGSSGSYLMWGGSGVALTYLSSSRRFKTDIQPLSMDEAERVLDFEPVRYRENPETVGDCKHPEWSYYGFIAEDIEPIDPRFVQYLDGQVASVDYARVVVPLLTLVKDLRARITILENKHGTASVH